jgi:hypothetical protein
MTSKTEKEFIANLYKQRDECRDEVARQRFDIEHLKSEQAQLAETLNSRDRWRLQSGVAERERDELRAEVERLRAVAEATRTYVFGLPSSGSKYDAVIAALAALDACQT